MKRAPLSSVALVPLTEDTRVLLIAQGMDAEAIDSQPRNELWGQSLLVSRAEFQDRAAAPSCFATKFDPERELCQGCAWMPRCWPKDERYLRWIDWEGSPPGVPPEAVDRVLRGLKETTMQQIETKAPAKKEKEAGNTIADRWKPIELMDEKGSWSMSGLMEPDEAKAEFCNAEKAARLKIEAGWYRNCFGFGDAFRIYHEKRIKIRGKVLADMRAEEEAARKKKLPPAKGPPLKGGPPPKAEAKGPPPPVKGLPPKAAPRKAPPPIAAAPEAPPPKGLPPKK